MLCTASLSSCRPHQSSSMQFINQMQDHVTQHGTELIAKQAGQGFTSCLLTPITQTTL